MLSRGRAHSWYPVPRTQGSTDARTDG